MRLSLIGAGDISFHYLELLRLSKAKLERQLSELAAVLVEAGVELVLLPDRGISFELAKRYKQLGGARVFGTVPLSDRDFGIAHLQPYISAKIDGKKLFDAIIDTQNWYKQDLTCALYGDALLMLGNSLGSLGELAYAFYLYKLFIGAKPGVRLARSRIHPEIRAGRMMPYAAIIYMPLMRERLNFEIEEYVKALGELYYAASAGKLKSILNKLAGRKT